MKFPGLDAATDRQLRRNRVTFALIAVVWLGLAALNVTIAHQFVVFVLGVLVAAVAGYAAAATHTELRRRSREPQRR